MNKFEITVKDQSTEEELLVYKSFVVPNVGDMVGDYNGWRVLVKMRVFDCNNGNQVELLVKQ